MTVYRVVPDGRSTIRTNEQAQRVGEYLAAKFGDNPVTPEQYVKAARPARSALHDTLEWNDMEAAHQHRLQQARQVLRSIVIEHDPDARVHQRAYHSVALVTPEGAHRAYVPQHIVWATEELADQVVASALHELRSWTARYSAYKDNLDSLRTASEHVDKAKQALA